MSSKHTCRGFSLEQNMNFILIVNNRIILRHRRWQRAKCVSMYAGEIKQGLVWWRHMYTWWRHMQTQDDVICTYMMTSYADTIHSGNACTGGEQRTNIEIGPTFPGRVCLPCPWMYGSRDGQPQEGKVAVERSHYKKVWLNTNNSDSGKEKERCQLLETTRYNNFI